MTLIEGSFSEQQKGLAGLLDVSRLALAASHYRNQFLSAQQAFQAAPAPPPEPNKVLLLLGDE